MAALYVNNKHYAPMYICTLANVSNRLDYGRAPQHSFVKSRNFGRFLIETQHPLELIVLPPTCKTPLLSHHSRLNGSVSLAALSSRQPRSRILEGGIESSAPSIVERERQPVYVLFMTSANGARPCLTSASPFPFGMRSRTRRNTL